MGEGPGSAKGTAVQERRLRQAKLFSEEEHFAAGDAFGERRRLIFTIGHSTRKLEELISALKHYHIQRLVDIRHFPSSRHNPQFNKSELGKELRVHGIAYAWLEQLGGYRSRGYRAYMDTPDFAAGIGDLEKLAIGQRTAYMCAEVKWWQCHRRHISDVLAARGWSVVHIFDENGAEEHYPKNNRIKCD